MTGLGRHGAGGAGGPAGAQVGVEGGRNRQQRKPGDLLEACVLGVGDLGHSSDCREAERQTDLGHLLGAGPTDLLIDWGVLREMDRSGKNTGILA